MLQRWRHRRRCQRLAAACQQPVLREYLKSCAELKVGTMADTPLIAVDLELTGLDKNRHGIVAIGWTQLDQGRIRMGSNRHLLVSADSTVGHSATIHEIRDSDLSEATELDTGLAELFEAAHGRLWIFHHAGLDVNFLKVACRRWAGLAPGFIVLDTLRIEYRRRRRREIAVKAGDLQLGSVRGAYGLPQYTAHNALTDAVATAELMLAIASLMAPDEPLELAPHLKFF